MTWEREELRAMDHECVCVCDGSLVSHKHWRISRWIFYVSKGWNMFLKLHNETVVLLGGRAGSHPDVCSSVWKQTTDNNSVKNQHLHKYTYVHIVKESTQTNNSVLLFVFLNLSLIWGNARVHFFVELHVEVLSECVKVKHFKRSVRLNKIRS